MKKTFYIFASIAVFCAWATEHFYVNRWDAEEHETILLMQSMDMIDTRIEIESKFAEEQEIRLTGSTDLPGSVENLLHNRIYVDRCFNIVKQVISKDLLLKKLDKVSDDSINEYAHKDMALIDFLYRHAYGDSDENSIATWRQILTYKNTYKKNVTDEEKRVFISVQKNKELITENKTRANNLLYGFSIFSSIGFSISFIVDELKKKRKP